jgi:polysaccharide export outer membrane protein
MIVRTTLRSVITVFIVALLLSACSTTKLTSSDYLYFQNGADTVSSRLTSTTIKPNDVLFIQVYSKTLNQEQAAIFNLPQPSNGTEQGYKVNAAGAIEMPVLGDVPVLGFTIDELQASLKQRLVEYVKNPMVTAHYIIQFQVNVLGEVKAPGLQRFSSDRVSILDAINASGDLTDFGKRDNIKVIREENGKRIYYTVDIRNKDIFNSPVYLLHPNDIIYVGMNDNKIKSLGQDPTRQQKTNLILTLAGFALSIGTFLIYYLK